MSLILREVTPLSEGDCFMIFSREKSEFTFPIHTHAEYELNFIENGLGAKRVVGDSVEEIEDLELTLITGGDLEHGWLNHKCKSPKINEITIQFQGDLLNEQLLMKKQFRSVKEMLEKASCGITFSRDTILVIKDRLYALTSEHKDVHSVLKLFAILYDLSLSPSIRELSSRSFQLNRHNHDSRRVERVHNYMLENYSREIKLSDVAGLIGMTDVAFSRFLKKTIREKFYRLA